MKKFLALLMAVVLVVAVFAGCSSNEESSGSSQGSQSGSESSGSASGKPGEGKKVALVCDKVGTQVFVMSMVDGLEAAAEKYGFEYTVAESADAAAYEDNMRALVEEGYDLIIGGGWQSGEALGKIATEFPDAADYALVDSEIDAEPVKCYSFREQEGAYLIGMIAASVVDGESNLYGAIHVNEGPGSWKWRYGYMEGVKAIDPDAEFVFNYVGSYSDPAKAKELAIQQFEQGALFINSAAAGGDSGTFEAAKEKGFYTSGQDVDLTDPENPYIVTSQMKDTNTTVQYVIDQWFSGEEWTEDDEVLGVKEGAIGAVHITHESPNPISERLSEEEIAKIKEAAEAIANGTHDMTNYPTEEEYFAAQ